MSRLSRIVAVGERCSECRIRAVAQPSGTDVYFNSRADAVRRLTEGDIFREALHNPTDLSDSVLQQQVEILVMGFTFNISTALHGNGCTED